MADKRDAARRHLAERDAGQVKDEQHGTGGAPAAVAEPPASDGEELAAQSEAEAEVATPKPAPAHTEPVISDPTGLLTADEILAGADVTRLESIEVEVGEWTPGWAADNDVEARKVRMRVMTGDEAMEFAAQQAKPGVKDTMMRLICTCAVNEDNKPVFSEQQLKQIGGLSFGVLQRLQNAALILNGFAEEGDAQEAAGNG